jgi:hypothetical protein
MPFFMVTAVKTSNVTNYFLFFCFRYVLIGRSALKNITGTGIPNTVKLIQRSAFSLDSSFQVMPPKVSKASQEIYCQYLERGRLGASKPSHTDLLKYQKYASDSILQHDDWEDTL